MATDITEDIRKLTPIIGEESVPRIEAAYLLGDELAKQRITEAIDAIKASILSDDSFRDVLLMEPPSQAVAAAGDIEIGSVLYGKNELYPLQLKDKDMLTHIGIFGSSGCGKTNAIHWLAQKMVDHNIPLVIFDFSKRNYRDLLQNPKLKERIRIYTIGRNVSPYRFNPLKPPEGVQISQWIKEFAEVFDHAYWLLGGGRHIILKALDDIFERCENGWPKVADLKIWLEKYAYATASQREKNWLSTAERPLESLCFREVGEIFDCDEGILPSEFFKPGSITILELDSLSTNDKTFFIEVMLQWIRDWLLVSGNREKLVGVIAVEEAHHILNREKTRRLGMETVMELIFREVRELGIGVVYVDQHPSLISYPALGNTSTHVYMNLGLDTKQSSDVLDAAHMLGLKTQEEVDYLRKLAVGQAFVVCRKLAFPNPFLMQFPLVNIKKGLITDEDVKNLMLTKIIEDYRKLKVPQLNVPEPMPKPDVVKEVKLPEEIIKELDAASLDIIKIIGSGGGVMTSDIYSKLSMSGRTFKNKADELVEAGLIARREVKVYRQNALCYYLTDAGKEIFNARFKHEVAQENIEQLRDAVAGSYTAQIWNKIEFDANRVIFRKGDEVTIVNVIAGSDIDNVPRIIEEQIEDDIINFVCSSEAVKNLVIGQAAKHASHASRSFGIRIITLDELKLGKGLRSLEFKILL